MADASPRGRFVWHELMTSDPDAAIRYYPKITGWKVTPFPADPSYRMWTVGETPIGGLMRLPDEAKQMGAPPHWLAYVAVPDVDATVRQATGLGARTYVPPQDIPQVGRFAVLADPQGATFAIFRTAGTWPGHEGMPNVGEFSWHELMTSDWKSALGFYQALFGWDTAGSVDMGAMGTYQMFSRNGVILGGMFNRPDAQVPPHWLGYIRVPDVDKAATLVTGKGGSIMHGPIDVPGGDRVVMCRDAQGVAFALHTAAADRAAVSTPPAASPAKAAAAKKVTTAPAASSAAKKATTAPAAKTAAKKATAAPAAKKAAAAGARRSGAASRSAKPKAKRKAASRRPTARKATARKAVRKKSARPRRPVVRRGKGRGAARRPAAKRRGARSRARSRR